MNMQLVIIFSALFFISEMTLMLVKRSKKIDSKVNNDKKSLIIFWFVIPISITLGFMLANYSIWNLTQIIIAIAGLFVFIAGISIRWIAIIQLADEFTVDVSIVKNHKLKTTGLYQIVRHPSYMGLLMLVVGLSIAMNSFFSILVISIPIFLAINYRIKIEETTLLKEFKQFYLEYSRKTKSLIPYIY